MKLSVFFNDKFLEDLIMRLLKRWTLPEVNLDAVEKHLDCNCNSFCIQYGVNAKEAAKAIESRLSHLELPVHENPSLNPDEVSLYIYNPFQSERSNAYINLHSDTDEFRKKLLDIGIPLHKISSQAVNDNRIICYTDDSYYRDIARFFQIIFLLRNINPKAFYESSEHNENEVELYVSSYNTVKNPPRKPFPISVFTDDENIAKTYFYPLAEQGYTISYFDFNALAVYWRNGWVRSANHYALPWFAMKRFAMFAWGADSEFPQEYQEIKGYFEKILSDLNAHECPIEERIFQEMQAMTLVFPIKEYVQGSIPPYPPDSPSRLRVEVSGDSAKLVEAVVGDLKERNMFHSVEAVPWALKDMDVRFPVVLWPKNFVNLNVVKEVREFLDTQLKSRIPYLDFILQYHEFKEDVVYVRLPVRESLYLNEQLYQSQVMAKTTFRLGVSGPKGKSSLDFVCSKLSETFGLRNVNTITDGSAQMQKGIYYGLAPRWMLQNLASFLQKLTNEEFPLVPKTEELDPAIEIFLPDQLERRTMHFNFRSFISPPAASSHSDRDTFVHETADGLLVGRWRMDFPKFSAGHPLIPSGKDFLYFIVDRNCASILEHIASAVVLREPCLLEGETSTAKTSSIQYLAYRLKQPVLRMNLNGQTDASELVGRWIPDPDNANKWIWKDGLVVEAMKNGYWIIFDEMNLARPEVLERLNSVFEKNPSIVLTEKDNSVIRNSDVHPEFRVFATMNPSLYVGRSSLSQALRDRFSAYMLVKPPDEGDLEMFLRGVIQGIASEFEWNERKYKTNLPFAGYPRLREQTWIVNAIPKIARFHVEISAAFSQKPGAPGNEPIAFTRRALLSLLAYLDIWEKLQPEELVKGLHRYYVNRLDPSVQDVALSLLKAHGF